MKLVAASYKNARALFIPGGMKTGTFQELDFMSGE